MRPAPISCRARAEADGPCPEELPDLSFFLGLQFLVWISFTLAWLGGGRPERLAVAVLSWDYVLGRSTSGMPGGHDLVGVSEVVVALVFTWIAFRSERWWALFASAALMLCALVFLLEWTRPNLSEYAAISARLGLWFIIHLALVAGVVERWLAGEVAVSPRRIWRPRSGRGRWNAPPSVGKEGGGA